MVTVSQVLEAIRSHGVKAAPGSSAQEGFSLRYTAIGHVHATLVEGLSKYPYSEPLIDALAQSMRDQGYELEVDDLTLIIKKAPTP